MPFLPAIFLIMYIAAFPLKIATANDRKNNIFLEAGGFGGYGSLNYERLIFAKGYLKIGTRAGFGTYKIGDFSRSFNPDIILPISMNICYGYAHQVEFDFGNTWASIVYAPGPERELGRDNSISTNIGIGYRYQKEQKGVFFRMTYTPYLLKSRMFRNWWGLSVGYGF